LRLFKTRLAPFSSVPSQVFTLAHPHYPCVRISDDLSRLSLITIPSKNKTLSTIRAAISKDLSIIPAQKQLEIQNNQLHIPGLVDIHTTLRELAAQIKVDDPSFFSRLLQFESESENDENDNGQITDILTTPLSGRYFIFQGLRSEGMHHTLEIVLRTLKKRNIITHDELLQLLRHVWPTTSAHRAMIKSEPLNKSNDIPFTPYVFKPTI